MRGGQNKTSENKITKAKLLYYRGWSAEDIAKEIGVGESTLYRYFAARSVREVRPPWRRKIKET